MSSKSSSPAMLFQRRGASATKQAVDVPVFLHVHHGAYGLIEQVGINSRLVPVVCGLTEQTANFRQWLALPLTGTTHQVEQASCLCLLGSLANIAWICSSRYQFACIVGFFTRCTQGVLG